MALTLEDAVSAFGASVKSKLGNPAAKGAPEDQLRGPLQNLFNDFGVLTGFAGSLELVGETSQTAIKARPDFAVTIHNALTGFIELKAPGKGADPRKFTDEHDRAQWQKLKLLPNILYTDGNSFSLWRDGQIVGRKVTFSEDVETAGAKLAPPPELLPLIANFLTWEPIPPKSVPELARIAARLCRLLRDEVTEQLSRNNAALRQLAYDWRALLFPKADDEQFADGYAQAVTFGLLIARAKGLSLKGGLAHAAIDLEQSNSLIGTALTLLTGPKGIRDDLKTSLDTLTRVLDQVNWAAVSKGKSDPWLYFYEDFLEVYDNRLRKLTGSYYTPPEVVEVMTGLVDEALRGPLFERAAGLASPDVTIADPAVGTGTFILGALRKIADNIADDQGEGAVSDALRAAAKRIYGFELQFGPFAVAQLRILAELQSLSGANKAVDVNLFITDTLGNPFQEEEQLPQIVEPVARSRREANRIKRGQPITVVIGNPPYKEKAEGRGGWIEAGSGGKLTAPLDWWKAPPEWGVGAHGKHLKNLYVYFWRWAALKVFGSGLYASTGQVEKDEEGLICFITVAGFLNGPGFEKMRDDLRRTCCEIWVIDCSPEGHQPDVPTRIFQGVQQPVCIVLAAKRLGKEKVKIKVNDKFQDEDVPARVHFRALPAGRREEKFKALKTITLDDEEWEDCPSAWRAPFLPAAAGAWSQFAQLRSLFAYDGSGVMPGRTWIIAPDTTTLEQRWRRLTTEKDDAEKEKLFHPHLRRGKLGDRHIKKGVGEGLSGHEARLSSVATDKNDVVRPARYAFRSFDRQWIIPDARLINQPNPTLWKAWSPKQIFITAPEDRSISNGPALTLAAFIPDLHHYHGRGGRVYPLWSDAKATQPNIRREALELLARTYGAPVSPDDLFAYIAALMAHPSFTERFQSDLLRPGLRLPLTADAALFQEAAALGREIVWLHCYGERFADPQAGRPKAAPRMDKAIEPTISKNGAVPPAPEPLPDEMWHDPATNRLHVGKGFVDNVTTAMWDYEISGKNVLRQWFSYRRRDRSKPIIGDRRPPSPLEQIQPEGWLPEYTSDLLDLLRVLGRVIALHPAQAALLARICDGPLIGVEELRGVGLAEAAETAQLVEE